MVLAFLFFFLFIFSKWYASYVTDTKQLLISCIFYYLVCSPTKMTRDMLVYVRNPLVLESLKASVSSKSLYLLYVLNQKIRLYH